MLNPTETKKALTKFARNVVKASRNELKSQKKNTSGKLSKSIDFDLQVFKNSFGLSFEMEDYGQFQNSGVSGFLKKYDTPFSYTDKYPPGKKLDKWIVKKGIAPKDKKGRFISRKSLQFLISRKIFFYGIKPSLFFTKPFEKAFKNLPNEVIEAFALDTENFLKSTLKND
ncbi:hypothetical protein [Costertonia aggregata]|uniref:HK97 gp10 family phage protein n=1 Tax=Costertonia aggregata TaxID=343403 RepID=A0A7H9ARE2_9FLAO|nr:hypothetical protein [Costertonia aggregata]QLG46048.1 hypothetical protein HYG79_12065 [Costertonia aggregata]